MGVITRGVVDVRSICVVVVGDGVVVGIDVCADEVDDCPNRAVVSVNVVLHAPTEPVSLVPVVGQEMVTWFGVVVGMGVGVVVEVAVLSTEMGADVV